VRPARAVARCRVDLAGGTLDIWPLGLLHPGASTVNVAVDLAVEVALLPRAAGFTVASDREGEVSAQTIAELVADPRTALVGRVVEELGLGPCAIRTASASPRGAGLAPWRCSRPAKSRSPVRPRARRSSGRGSRATSKRG
jgi:D-glycero-alpha-D-manno-heptose-7-phosphate kinase